MDETRDLLNRIYAPLDAKRAQLTAALKEHGFPVEWGFYNGHYHETSPGTYAVDHFPIPVLTVPGLCDIELDLEQISVSAKLRRDDALARSFAPLGESRFEAYGVEDYLATYYREGMTLGEMRTAIEKSAEAEIGFSFFLPASSNGGDVAALAELLRREGFSIPNEKTNRT